MMSRHHNCHAPGIPEASLMNVAKTLEPHSRALVSNLTTPYTLLCPPLCCCLLLVKNFHNNKAVLLKSFDDKTCCGLGVAAHSQEHHLHSMHPCMKFRQATLCLFKSPVLKDGAVEERPRLPRQQHVPNTTLASSFKQIQSQSLYSQEPYTKQIGQ